MRSLAVFDLSSTSNKHKKNGYMTLKRAGLLHCQYKILTKKMIHLLMEINIVMLFVHQFLVKILYWKN